MDKIELDDEQKLRKWLQANRDKAVNVWGVSPVGNTNDWGINPETYPWEYEDVYTGYTWQEINHFSSSDNQCKFVGGNISYTLTIAEFPSDKWGNTATYEEGLRSGIELGYSDNSYTDYAGVESIFRFAGVDTDELDDFDHYKFIQWVEQHHEEIISSVSESGTFGGCGWCWTYHTTNTELNDPLWAKVALEYIKTLNGERYVE